MRTVQFVSASSVLKPSDAINWAAPISALKIPLIGTLERSIIWAAPRSPDQKDSHTWIRKTTIDWVISACPLFSKLQPVVKSFSATSWYNEAHIENVLSVLTYRLKAVIIKRIDKWNVNIRAYWKKVTVLIMMECEWKNTEKKDWKLTLQEYDNNRGWRKPLAMKKRKIES